MRNFIISTESSCDLTKAQLEKLNINILPMKFYVNGVEYDSNTTSLSTNELCNKMREGVTTKTSQPNETEVQAYLEKLLLYKQDILHVSFSSAMSGTYETFKRVAESLNKSHENKIYVVDSLCQSAGVGLLLNIAIDEINKKNLSIVEARDFIESIKLSIDHIFIVEDLKYLARGGRISNSVAVIGNLINLKPVLHLDEKGAIVQLQKTIGRKKSIAVLLDKFKNQFSGKSSKVYITEANAIKEAEEIKNKLLEINSDLDITINPLGPVITSHSGPGTIALFFMTKKR